MARNVQVTGKGAKGLLVTIDEALASPEVLRVIAQFVRDRIYTNTKRGYYAGTRKNLAKFRPLSPGYIKQRQAMVSGAAKNIRAKTGAKGSAARKQAIKSFGPFFSPKRSNLTLTGQMLEALVADVVNGQIRVQVPATSRDDGLTNKEVAEKVIEGGRPFLGLDDKGVDRIRESIIRSLRRLLKNR